MASVQHVDEMPVTPRTVTLTEATAAFEAWGTAYRDNPDAFLSPEAVAGMEVWSVAKAQAIHFMQLLHFNGQK